MRFISIATAVYIIQDVPGGKEDILNDDNIDNFEKKMSNKHMLKNA